MAAVVLVGQPLVPAAAVPPRGGGLLAWGRDDGQVGDGSGVTHQGAPVGVAGMAAGDDVVSVAGGHFHSLAVRADGSVLSWGGNFLGQLGDGNNGMTASRFAPGPVTGLGPGSGVVAVSAGYWHSLALRADGSVLAWGSNQWGELGDGAGGPAHFRSVPALVRGLGPGSGVVAISAGHDFNLALRSDGSVLSWGIDINGQLGDGGANANQSLPVAVSGLGPGSGIVSVAAGSNHGLALRGDGSVVGWGSDGLGAVGDGGLADGAKPVPVAVSGLGPGSGVVAVAAGVHHSLALRANGNVLAWGSEWGRNTGGNADRTAPVSVSGLGPGSRVVEVAAGAYHSLVRRADGSVLAWGSDSHGQLGDGGPVDPEAYPSPAQVSPVPVAGLGAGSGVTMISGGGSHSLAAFGGEQQGYALVAADGGVATFGAARWWGSTRGTRLNRPVVGMSYTASGNGYSLVASDGGIFGFGDFRFFGSTGGIPLNQPVVGMKTTPSGGGYWLVASDGGIFAFGDARFHGSTGGIRLNMPVVGMERTASGNGYWLVASDGGIFAFGDAPFLGSTGSVPLNRPIVGMSRTKSGAGYQFAAQDGGVFVFGDAPFFGALDRARPTDLVVGIMPPPLSDSYWLCSRDGGIVAFGSAHHLGSSWGRPLPSPIVGCTATAPV